MTLVVTVPELGPISTSPVLAEWLVPEGEVVTEGQPLCTVEADKVTVEVECTGGGVLRHHLVAQGGAVVSGGAIALVSVEGGESIPEALLNGQHQPPLTPIPPVPQLVPEEKADLVTGPVEPLDAMRKVVARRMTESKLSAPHFYLTTAIDMTGCAELRKTLKAEKIRATYNDMLIKAAGLSLRQFPRMASLFSSAGYLPRDRMNVGFAVATEPEGLVVPVIRDADKKSLAAISVETKLLIEKVRRRKLVPADYAEGVFSISNLGQFDVDAFTAIVNPGEAAILAIGKIVETPVVVDGAVAIRPIMKVTLSSDHRVIDGILAAKFNGFLKKLLQEPTALVE